jgi:predicted nucleic acid-binding protein
MDMSDNMDGKSLVFDSGAIISLALNNLLWILEPLKQKFQGDFLICPAVRNEIVEKPMATKKFKFEAIQVKDLLDKDVVSEVAERKDLSEMTERMLFYANNSFQAWGNYIKIVHEGEMQSLALVKLREASALVVDERNMRILIEDPEMLARIMKSRLHTNIKIDWENLKKFQQMIKGAKAIRSLELAALAYEMGLFSRYNTDKKELLDALLWGIKLNGCSVSEDEINELVRIER